MSCNLLEVDVLESGIQGLSAYEVYVQNGGELSETQWLESLKGESGQDGYTPVKGTDYWTESDVNEIKDYVDEEIGKIDFSDYATKEEIPDISNLATKDEIPDISNLAEKSEIPDISNLAEKSEIPDVSEFATRSELPDVSDFITKEVDDLTNYELKTNTGASIELSINSSTYVMTASLKNSAGTVLNSQSIDLPLETMVIGASYDSTNKQIILTLKSGETTSFSVADLVSGLVSTNDLNSALALKQDTLTTGENITIDNGVISATDTTYDVATTSRNGLMSTSDKDKLDGIDMSTKQDILQVSTIPDASASDIGKIVQYIGETNNNYKNGYFYQVISETQTENNEEVTTYRWQNINIQDTGLADGLLHILKPVEGTDYVVINDGNMTAGLFYLVPLGYRIGFIDSNGDFKPFYMQGSNGQPSSYDEINGTSWGYGLTSVKIMCFSNTTDFATISSGDVYIKAFIIKCSPSYGSSILAERSLKKSIRNGYPTDGSLGTQGSAFPNGNYALRSEVLAKDNGVAFSPTNNYHPATKKYVDDSIANIDLSNYATTSYVDEAISTAITDTLGGEY